MKDDKSFRKNLHEIMEQFFGEFAHIFGWDYDAFDNEKIQIEFDPSDCTKINIFVPYYYDRCQLGEDIVGEMNVFQSYMIPSPSDRLPVCFTSIRYQPGFLILTAEIRN